MSNDEIEIRTVKMPGLKLPWQLRLRIWWHRVRLGRKGRAIADELARETDRVWLGGDW